MLFLGEELEELHLFYVLDLLDFHLFLGGVFEVFHPFLGVAFVAFDGEILILLFINHYWQKH